MNNSNICQYCEKEFSNKGTLLRHQTTTKSCLELQGKNDVYVECSNCKKKLVITSYDKHKIKCDINTQEKEEKNLYVSLQKTHKLLEKQNKKLKIWLNTNNHLINQKQKRMNTKKNTNH